MCCVSLKNSIMKSINVIALIALSCLNSLSAQEPTQKIKIYRTWVSLNSEPFKIKGVLYELKDSSIVVSSSLVIQDYRDLKLDVKDLNIHYIETIKIRRHNSIRRGALIGVATGFVLGGIIGSSLEEPCKPGELCFPYYASGVYGSIGMAGGAAIGAVIGSFKLTIPINGSINSYNRHENKLREYSIKKQ
jgi:hypothetical protein